MGEWSIGRTCRPDGLSRIRAGLTVGRRRASTGLVKPESKLRGGLRVTMEELAHYGRWFPDEGHPSPLWWFDARRREMLPVEAVCRACGCERAEDLDVEACKAVDIIPLFSGGYTGAGAQVCARIHLQAAAHGASQAGRPGAGLRISPCHRGKRPCAALVRLRAARAHGSGAMLATGKQSECGQGTPLSARCILEVYSFYWYAARESKM